MRLLRVDMYEEKILITKKCKTMATAVYKFRNFLFIKLLKNDKKVWE